MITKLRSLVLLAACAALLSACGQSPTSPSRIASVQKSAGCVGVRQEFRPEGLFVENCTDQVYIAGFGASSVPRVNGKPDPDLTHQTLLAQTSYTLEAGTSATLSIAYELPCDMDAQWDGWKLTHTVPNAIPRDPSSGKPRVGPSSLIPGSTEAGEETIGTIVRNRGAACAAPPVQPPIVPPVPPIVLRSCSEANLLSAVSSHDSAQTLATVRAKVKAGFGGFLAYLNSWGVPFRFAFGWVPLPQTRVYLTTWILHEGDNVMTAPIVSSHDYPAWQTEPGCEPGPLTLTSAQDRDHGGQFDWWKTADDGGNFEIEGAE